MQFLQTYIDAVEKHSKNSALFFPRMAEVAKRLGIQPEWLANVIYIESGFRPFIKNPESSASGLIQFMESTAKGLGTTTAKIRSMSNIEQLPFVERYFKGQIATFGKPRDWFDTYLLVFYPTWVKKDDNALLASNAYQPNRSIDINKDGKITKGEFRVWANKQLPKSALAQLTETAKKQCPHCLQFS